MCTSCERTATPAEHEYAVTGMTCDHCAAAVRGEVTALDGVDAAEVDLARGRLLVRGAAAGDAGAIRAAVEEAGYEVAP